MVINEKIYINMWKNIGLATAIAVIMRSSEKLKPMVKYYSDQTQSQWQISEYYVINMVSIEKSGAFEFVENRPKYWW